MLQRLLWAGMAACVLVLMGCAHSPQQLDPIPKLKGPITPVGQGQPVVVQIVDNRPSPVLGTRGGLYPETSAVTVPAERLRARLQSETEAGVRLMGFTPASGPQNIPHLTLTVAELKYQSPKDSVYVTEAVIRATLLVEVRVANRSYNGRYSATLDQKFGMAPNEQTNNELVSEVLSDVLSRVFKDQGIGQLMLGR
ncbi:putative lipoprotein [Azomonas agilis]|uniref:Putative lipoprotein n=1 Tax=Azomonas agilis TaxID=116849 RepID=A0A562J1U2_9GAMM|nr:YajG family lipoprotein [Azomonas agilis]TWH77148.1 putative lipoprotein [Azomonas agilis]